MYVYKVDGLGQEGREEQQVREEHFQKYFLFFFLLARSPVYYKRM